MDLMGRGEITSERCELCNDVASWYCPSDSAFLCWGCDSKVHSANFLVARHQRLPLNNNLICCSIINYNKTSTSNSSSSASLSTSSPSNFVSTTYTEESTSSHGGGARRDFDLRRKCNSPNNNNDDDNNNKKTDDENNNKKKNDKKKKKKKNNNNKKKKNDKNKNNNNNASRGGGADADQYNDDLVVSTDSDCMLSRAKVEAILRNWCRNLGLDARSVVPPAIHVYGAANAKYNSSNNSSSKLRAAAVLAASLLAGIKISILSFSTSRRRSASTVMMTIIRKVEEVTGVPRKLIAALEANLTKIDNKHNLINNHQAHSHNSHLQEGWAES